MAEKENEKNKSRREHSQVADEIFDFSGSDAETLRSGRIPDPQPEHTALFRWLADVLGAAEEFLRARGGINLRWAIRLFWGLIAAIGIFLLVGPIINKPMDFDDVIANSKFKDVDWIAQNASFDYDVTRDDDGGFTTTVHERYTANFVNGAERDITRRLVTEVHGHDAEFELVKASIDGAAVDPQVTPRATTTDIVLTRPSGEKFAGTHEVELTYTLHNLIENADDSVTGDPVDEWTWPVFAPSWTQATSGLEVSITLPRDLDDALERKPYATVGWLLVSGNVWLEPDEETSEWVRYAFTNDDNLPPNSDVWIRFIFADGTFVQPPETTLFWVQTWGPLLPLAVLLVIMLFALAARWVVWADTAGDPWFVVRTDPPDDLEPTLAARLMRKARHAELVSALARVAGRPNPGGERKTRRQQAAKQRADAQHRRARDRGLRELAQTGRRAGRAGNLPSVFAWSSRWANDEMVARGLRWKPDSYVRDTFLFAPIAVTLVQWGILRQISEQLILLVVWWPFVFVLVSTIIAGIAIWAVRRPRPLTRKGALTMQQLKGIDVYARGTRLIDRGPVDDELLPYAVLFESPRTAGNKITEHAIRESGDRGIVGGWRGSHFLSIPAMLGLVVSIALFAGAIVLTATQPIPYDNEEMLTWPSSDTKGAIWTQVEGFELEAELTRDEQGAARIEAVEHLTVGFAPRGGSVPQVEREWTATRFGQDLDLTVSSVRIDGAEVPFDTRFGQRTVAVATKLTDVLEGVHDVEVRYSIAHPAVEMVSGGDTVQQVRWVAALRFWEDTYYTNQGNAFGGTTPVRPLRLQFTVAPDLVAEVQSGGWIAHGDADREPYESGTGYDPWEYEKFVYVDGSTGELGDTTKYDLRIGDETIRTDGALVATLDADEIQSRVAERGYREDYVPAGEYAVDAALNDTFEQYDLGRTADLGATLDFPEGTFTNVTEGAYDQYRVSYQTPLVTLVLFTLFAFAVAIAVGAVVVRSAGRIGSSVLLTSFGTVTFLALAQSVMFWWVTPEMSSGGRIALLITTALLMWCAVIVQWIIAGRAAAGLSVRPADKGSKG